MVARDGGPQGPDMARIGYARGVRAVQAIRRLSGRSERGQRGLRAGRGWRGPAFILALSAATLAAGHHNSIREPR